MKHANDDFLTDITTLRETDSPILNPGLERNGLSVEVERKCRPPVLDSNQFGCGGINFCTSGLEQRAPQLQRAGLFDP